MFSGEVLYFIQIWVMINILIILGLTSSIYIVQFISARNKARKTKTTDELLRIFHASLAASSDKKLITIPSLSAKHHYFDIILTINKFEEDIENNAVWLKLREQLAKEQLVATARKYAKSRYWFKNFQALMCFNFYMDATDDLLVEKLLHSKIPIITLHACRVAIKYSMPRAINTVIDWLNETRKPNRSLYIHYFKSSSQEVITLLLERFLKEDHPYIKVGLYDIFANLLPQQQLLAMTLIDSNAELLELKLAALRMLSHLQPENLGELLAAEHQDEHWEVRALIAKQMGIYAVTEKANILLSLLKDSEWWVRLNAAHALLQLNDEGKQTLLQLNKEDDLYAYEAAQHALQHYNKKLEN